MLSAFSSLFDYCVALWKIEKKFKFTSDAVDAWPCPASVCMTLNTQSNRAIQNGATTTLVLAITGLLDFSHKIVRSTKTCGSHNC